MEDLRIVELYWDRSERAISETSSKYGAYCYAIAYHILADAGDADESVNDTYLGAWNSIPPHRPSVLSTFLGKLTRHISIDRWRERRAEKRGGGQVPLALDELAEAVGAPDTPEQALDARELAAAIDRFLASLPEAERDLFVCRYWFLAPVAQLSEKFGFSLSKTKSMLFRTRQKLRTHLEKEGFI